MKKLLIICIAFCILSPKVNAQLWKLRRIEVSGSIGTTQLYGDIGGYPNKDNVLGIKDFTLNNTRFNINTSIRYRFTEDISVRANFMGGMFYSTDAGSSQESRGLQSTTTFFEPSLIAEYYVIKNKAENSFLFMKGKKSSLRSFFGSIDIYVFTGFGGIVYNVKPNDALAAQKTITSGFAGVVPLGVGVSMINSPDLSFGIEFAGRFALTDYLDGFTSSSSTANDIYHTLNFTVTYKIKKKSN
jgi:hypothetical protein